MKRSACFRFTRMQWEMSGAKRPAAISAFRTAGRPPASSSAAPSSRAAVHAARSVWPISSQMRLNGVVEWPTRKN